MTPDAVISTESVPQIKAGVVCGAANNQLANAASGQALFERGILFAPDFAANAGGIINARAEGPNYDKAKVWADLDKIYDRCLRVFEKSAATGTPPEAAAELIVAELN